MTMSLLPRVLPFASLCLVDLHGCCWPICQSLALILPLLRLPHFLIELWSWEWVNGQLLLGLSVLSAVAQGSRAFSLWLVLVLCLGRSVQGSERGTSQGTAHWVLPESCL